MSKLFTIIFIAAISLIVYSQDFNVRIIKTDAENFPSLISSVQVYDSFNEPITDLQEYNFAASVDGKNSDSLKAMTYKQSGLGFNIMLCVDLSGSMDGKPLETTKNAILKFIEDMRSVDKLGIMGFANDAQLISDFSNDKDFLKDKVNHLSAMGNQTALFYGTYKGLNKIIENKDKVGKILILMSDGKDESVSSSYTENDVIDRAKKEGIPVFSIGYTKIDRTYLQSLERISEKTGGNFYETPTDKELTAQYQKLYRQILNIYLVNYLASGVSGDGGEHINVITVNYNKTTKTVSNKFIAPAGIAAINNETKIIEHPISLWYYFAAGGLLILLAASIILITGRNKKKKAELEKIKAEEERKKNEQIEAERKKRLDLEKKLEEANNPKQKSEPASSKNNKYENEEKTYIQPINRDERTIILKSDQQKQSSGSNLRLEILVGPNQGKRFDVSSGGATIGRKDDNNIIIKEETISGQHARITYSKGFFYLEDLGSSNGTFVNGKQIQNIQINHGDVFKFGKCEGTITIY